MDKIKYVPVRPGAPWLTILQLLLVILKVSNTVSWTWGVVLIPLWVTLGSFAFITLVTLLAILFVALLS